MVTYQKIQITQEVSSTDETSVCTLGSVVCVSILKICVSILRLVGEQNCYSLETDVTQKTHELTGLWGADWTVGCYCGLLLRGRFGYRDRWVTEDHLGSSQDPPFALCFLPSMTCTPFLHQVFPPGHQLYKSQNFSTTSQNKSLFLGSCACWVFYPRSEKSD